MKSNNRFLLKMLEHITPGLTSNVVSFFFFFYEYKLAEFLKKIEKITGVNYSLNALIYIQMSLNRYGVINIYRLRLDAVRYFE